MVDIGKTGQAPAAIGLRAYKGGALAVAVCVTGEGPRVLYSTTLKSHAETEPLSLEPYAIAYRMAHEQGVSRKDIEAAVARGREIQVEAARDSLRSLADRVTALGHLGVSVALLVNRATWMTDLVEYSLGWPDHVPVAENLAVREALRNAAARNGLALIEYDEKSLPGQAAETLGLKAEDLDSELKALGVAAGKPWRKEQKLACLAAWLAAATNG